MDPNLTIVLNYLKFEKSKHKDIKAVRLEGIIFKLQRFMEGNFTHIEDLTMEEKDTEEGANLKKHILQYYEGEDNPCENFRCKIDSEGPAYYFYDYCTVEGVSFETFYGFFKSTECICGSCNKN